MQVNISNQEIQDLASHQTAYQRGLAYYHGGRVENMKYNSDTRQFAAKVIGNYEYSVKVLLSRFGDIRDYECDCQAFERFQGACKHIVAVVKALQYKDIDEVATASSKKLAGEALLTFFENRPVEMIKDPLNLEIQLKVHLGYFKTIELFLRLGLQRLYVVKDLGAFLECLKKGESMEFGKQFAFEPYRQIFREEDQPVIDLLLEMYEQYEAWSELEHPYSSINGFPKKSLSLTGYYLDKFFDAVGDKEFHLYIEDKPPYITQVNREGLPLEFTLQEADNDISLSLDVEHLPKQITPDGRYYIYQDTIYLVSPSQRELLPPILKAFHTDASKTLILPNKKREFFASEALPALQKIGKVGIATELATKFVREDLQTQVFLERSISNGISARVEFHYGDNHINPFSTAEVSSEEKSQDFILIRNSEEERYILNILERSEFSVNQGKIYLEGDQKVFDFIQFHLPQLQEKAEIYYSEDFKLKIRSSVAFSGKIRLDEKSDLLEVSFVYNDLNEQELEDVLHALKLKKRYYRLEDGSFLDLNQPELKYIADLFNHLNLSEDQLSNDAILLPKSRALYIDSYLREVDIAGIQRNQAFKNLVNSILEPQDVEFEVPSTMEKVLRDYQKTGYKWLRTLATYGFGGILADDMGLGKTIQVLSFIQSLKNDIDKPVLVVAPSSLIYNWLEEAEKFTPELRVLVVDGTPVERMSLLADISDKDLVITSYPLLRRDMETYADLEFSYCIVDEAQHIKNPQTLNAKAVQQIKAKGYFALTGTPIENSLSELWSIFNFIMPGYLLSYPEFRKTYEIPIVKGEDPAPLSELSRFVTPFILRRLKKDVLIELPDKIESRMTAQMTEDQKKIYMAFLLQAKQDIAKEIQTVGFERSHIKILAVLTRLRQICSHPSLFIENYQGESGKMQLFEEILEDSLASGRRILVFSQFTSMLDIIESYLTEKGIEYFYLSGQTPSLKRIQMVNTFNSGVGKVFLISLRAGGTGLNLTGADMVIHFDPWWNPAVEDQATDRAHRIGQKKAVHVIKLVTQGTIEEKVYALQEKKKQLIQSVIKPGETFLTKLTEEDLRGLFDI